MDKLHPLQRLEKVPKHSIGTRKKKTTQQQSFHIFYLQLNPIVTAKEKGAWLPFSGCG